ncbi:MAG: hypothetical protein ACJ8BC_10490 [Gemmatimonadales bacterium]
MARLNPSAALHVTPGQVWPDLAVDLRLSVVRLLARLAYASVTTPLAPSVKETEHAATTTDLQDPPRAS